MLNLLRKISSIVIVLTIAITGTVSAQDKLPGGVSYRLKEADKLLQTGEKAMNPANTASQDWKNETAKAAVASAREKMKEIAEKFAGQYSAAHPDIVAMETRIAQLEQSVSGQAAKPAKETGSKPPGAESDWVSKLKPYITGLGQPDHDPKKYLIPSATQDQTEMADRAAIYSSAKADLDAFKKSGTPLGGDLESIVPELERSVSEFESSCVSYADYDISEASEKLGQAEQFMAEQKAKIASKQTPNLFQKDILPYIESIVNRAAGLVKPDDSRITELRKRIETVRTTDLEIRKTRISDTRMTQEKYTGGDAAAVKEKAMQILKKAHPEANAIKTAIISSDWKEESVLEFTDTTQTALRYRVTRSLTVQIGADNGSEAFIYTIDISKDKRSDGSFGELYGHVMYTDPILKENIAKQ